MTSPKREFVEVALPLQASHQYQAQEDSAVMEVREHCPLGVSLPLAGLPYKTMITQSPRNSDAIVPPSCSWSW